MPGTVSTIRLAARALALALFATACGGGGGGGGGTPTSPQAPTTLVVEIRDYQFTPKSIRIQPGDTVTWRLVGSDSTHSVTAVGGFFASGFTFTQPGATYTRTFPNSEAGRTFEYWCDTHQASHGMRGSVLVGVDAPDPAPGY